MKKTLLALSVSAVALTGAAHAQSASDLAAFEIALQASLDSTARIIQPSLLNFLS